MLTGGGGDELSLETVRAQGVIEPEDVADAVVAGLADERFLILPHPEVATLRAAPGRRPRPVAGRDAAAAGADRVVVNPALDELGLEIGQLVHFRRSTDRRWQDGVVLRRERGRFGRPARRPWSGPSRARRRHRGPHGRPTRR